MPHRITCYSRAYFTNIPNHKIVYAVKNIVKEERWSCLKEEKIFTSGKTGAGRGDIFAAAQLPGRLSMGMFTPTAIRRAGPSGSNALRRCQRSLPCKHLLRPCPDRRTVFKREKPCSESIILESVFLSDAALYLACFGNGPYLSADGGSDF